MKKMNRTTTAALVISLLLSGNAFADQASDLAKANKALAANVNLVQAADMKLSLANLAKCQNLTSFNGFDKLTTCTDSYVRSQMWRFVQIGLGAFTVVNTSGKLVLTTPTIPADYTLEKGRDPFFALLANPNGFKGWMRAAVIMFSTWERGYW